RSFQQGCKRLQRFGATDESVSLGRQVVRDLACRNPRVGRSDDSIRLGRVGWRLERGVGFVHLKELQRLCQTLQAPMAMTLDRQPRARTTQRLNGRRGEQGLPAQSSAHDSSYDWQCNAIDLERGGAAHLVGIGVLPQRHLTYVQAYARLQTRADRSKRLVIRDSEGHSVPRVSEQDEKAVAPRDLLPAPDDHELSRSAIVSFPKGGHRAVPELVVELGAIDHVGEKQGQHRFERGARRRSSMLVALISGRVSAPRTTL